MANASTYTDEYRLECADCVISSGKPATQVAEGLGVHHKTPRHRAGKRRGRPGGKADAKAEPADVRELQRRIREPGRESEFPRKASAFLAADQAR